MNLLDPQLARVLDHSPDLAAAIGRGEIETVYQPQYGLPAEQVIGAEALARWQHPDLGEIGAGPLFAIAAEQGARIRLSQHIVDNAFAEFARWPGQFRLSVNVLPEEVAAPDFAPAFLARVNASGIDPRRLTLEITEEVLLGELARVAVSLDTLREAGLRIALDDFGAGFCNFRYLKILPLDYLKLDRSMVDGIAADARDLAVLRGIIAMASALDLRVIAEGIETERQLAIVTQEGCDTFQGFLRAAPMPAERFRALLEDQLAV
ncbi:EAL domain-containing protein [Parerythrobacter aestuarii]|uniref:EAL domain-containing protein n=1 Tax=Parerythrobacter aestuarii TaxID=3020909 RepID=UPI0024DF0076|nr:EAL domain-containing protein [Parerythrobacter aestuarii]